LSLIRRTVQTFLVLSSFAASALAGTNPHITAHPQVRIVDKVDNTKVTLVAKSHTPFVDGLTDMGRVASNTKMSHLILVMKGTDEQEFALQGLLDEQQDKTHPNYHQWMTPETFGAAFGVAKEDITKVTNWLQDGDMTIDSVAKGGRIVIFSGTVGQVESLFHTEMHKYSVKGVMHTSNSTDISIPTALASVVVGPKQLNDFKPKHDAMGYKLTTDGKGTVLSATPFGGTPDLSTNGSSNFPSGHFVGGGDLSVIYNTAPLFAKGIQGQGVTLGIIGQTDVLQSDIQTYRSVFGLPVNNFTRVQIGTDPGIIADDGESDLDLEVSGAMAPLANQVFYTSGNDYYGGGIDNSVEYVIEDNAADIFSTSYGECEYGLGAAGNQFYAYVYEQAAAQGQSIFISTGDDGPDTCGTYYSTNNPEGGYSVNGLASTPYNVAVGGTQFNEGATYNTPSTATTGTPYWGPFGTTTALSFVPDQPWNESYFGTGTYGGLTGGGSGISFYYQLPAWQVGPGVPTSDPNPPAGSYEATIPASNFVVGGPHRYLPDVSLNAAVYHDGTVFCSEGSCTQNSTGGLSNFGIVGGTSVASPTMAGAQALINQMNGGRQGNPNYYYYRAAAVQSATACVASNYVATAGCAFHDSQAGNTDVPAVRNSTTQEIGWNAGPGYDLAVGLDSPDVSNLATTWSKINFNATKTTMTITPVTGGTPGGQYNISVAVVPASGTGTPTGDVGIIAQALYGGLGWITLSNGTGTGTFSGLPAGTYCIYGHYEGDTKFGGSNSACTTITVSQATPTVAAASYSLIGTALTQTSNFAYGTNVYIPMGVLPPGTGLGVPSGNITLSLNNGTALTPYTTQLDPNGTYVGNTFYPGGAYFDAGLGLTNYDIAPTYPVLAPGTYTANVSYAGDSTFLPATAPPFTFVVGPYTGTLRLTAGTPDITSGATATLFGTIAAVNAAVGVVTANGTVSFTDTTTATALGTANMVNGAVTFTTNKLTTTGGHAITATFVGTPGAVGGSAYYATVTSATATVTVTTGATSVTTVSPQTAADQVLGTLSISASVPAATSGTVYFFDSFSGTPIEIGTGTVSSSTHLATLNIATLLAGTHPITATYGGTSTVSSSSSSVAVNYIVGQNTPTLTFTGQPSGNVGPNGYAMGALLTLSPSNGTRAASIAPTGNINFLDAANGAAAKTLGTGVATYQPGGYATYATSYVATTSQLVPGYHVLSEQYVGDANYAPATSNSLNVQIGITTLAITSYPTTPIYGGGATFKLSATVTPVVPSATAVTGTVNFYDGTLLIGTASVGIGNVATTLTAADPNIGTRTITAVYLGDSNYYTSTTATGVVITTIQPTFSGLSVAPNPLYVIRGQAGLATITATTLGNYVGTITYSCSGLPAYTTCAFGTNPSIFTTSGAATQTVALSIVTSPLTPIGSGGFLWIPALLFAGLLAIRRKQLSRGSRQFLAFAVILFGAMSLTGCGGKAIPHVGVQSGSPLGTSTVTITAVAAGGSSSYASGTLTTSLTVNIVAQ